MRSGRGLTEYSDILRSVLTPYCSLREAWLKEIGQRHVLILETLGRERVVLTACKYISPIGVSLWPQEGLFQFLLPSSHPKWETGKRTGNSPLKKDFLYYLEIKQIYICYGIIT